MSDRIEFLDYLRAIAIIFVVVAHYSNAMLPGGSIGVCIFFALSGYLVGRMILHAPDDSVRSMALLSARRFTRIYPPYLCSVAAVFVMAALFRPEDFEKMRPFLAGFLTFTYQPTSWINLGVGVFWTLYIEFWFYISLPMLAAAVGRDRAFFVALVVLIPISWCATYVGQRLDGSWVNGVSPFVALKWIDCLLYGTVIAILENKQSLRIPERFCRPIQVICIVLLFLIARFVSNAVTEVWIVEARVASIVTALLIAAFLVQPISLRIPGLAWFGRISYPIYLLHAVPAGYVVLTWPERGKSFVIFAGVVLASVVMHHLVEKPSITLSRKLRPSSSRQLSTA